MRSLNLLFGFEPVLGSLLASLPAYPGDASLFEAYKPSESLLEMMETDEFPSIDDAKLLVSEALAVMPEEALLSSSVNPRIIEWFHALNASDLNDDRVLSVPQLFYANEWVSVSNETKPFRPSQVLAHRLESVIMTTDSNPFDNTTEAVVKYQIDCRDKVRGITHIHQLAREYFFLDLVARNTDGIVPKPYLLSPPVMMRTPRTSKTDFDLAEEGRSLCVSVNSHVRYMLMERTGTSLEDFLAYCPKNRIPFTDGMRILRQLLVSLKSIHSLGIIHGDVHRGNIARSLKDGEKILLIDYGLAKFATGNFSEEPQTVTRSHIKADSSPWQVRGFVSSFRDDVFKAIVTVASLMGGIAHIQAFDQMETSNDQFNILHYLTRSDVFRNPSNRRHSLSYVRGLSDGDVARVVALLVTLQQQVRGIGRVNDFPNHDELISVVDEVIGIISLSK